MRRKLMIPYLLFVLAFAATPFGGQKAAFKAHFKGMVSYSEGHYRQAVRQFESAYSSIPHNYNFALSLAVGLSRVGRAAEGLSILTKASAQLSKHDPEYEQKLAFHHFFRGMVMVYDGRYGDAIASLKKSIELQRPLGQPKLLSIFHNALGYAHMLNQGGGHHATEGDLGMHYHVHRRDLLRALPYFDRALAYDPDNPAALHNYYLLRDTLGMVDLQDIIALRDSSFMTEAQVLPGNTERALRFADFDELLFLLDISGSMVMENVACMGATRFSVMQETALFVLDSLPEHTQIGLGTIGGDCGSPPKVWDAVGQLSRYDMRYRLRFLTPDGTTPLLERLLACPELFTANDSTRKAIFFISDGANVCRAGGANICGWAQDIAKRGIVVNVLTFLGTSYDNTNAFAEYGCLADYTGGQILYMDNYRCSYEYFGASLVESCLPKVPKLHRVNCWGPAVKDLWAIVPP
jgi:hypothetical protein